MDNTTTPQCVHEYVTQHFPITHNPVTHPNSNGLLDHWPVGEECSFVNPPFSDAQLWIEKAKREAQRGAASVLFVPAIFNSLYFRESVYPYASEIRILTCPFKIPGKSKQLVAQTALVVFAARDPETVVNGFPPVYLVEPESWADDYYKRPRNRSRFSAPMQMENP